MPLEPLPKELQAEYIAKALESSAPISILGYGVTTKPIVAFLNALGKACAIYDDKGKNVDSSGGGDVENILLDSRKFCPESSVLEILSPGIPPDHKYFGGARRAVSEYDFIWWLENSASGEQCGSVAKIVKGTTAKVANLPQFLQSSHSPTANPRILEEENQASPSLRAVSAKQSTLESSAKVDSRETAQNVSESQNKKAENVFSQNADRRQDCENLESTFDTAATLSEQAKDSRIVDEKSTQRGEAIHDSSPKAESPQIWISGTNGKTTTTQMLELLLSPYGARAGGNIGTPLITLYEQNTPLWVLETSSFALHYTKAATPAIYALLPLSPDHISWHNGFENYVCDKLSPLARMGADSAAILPSDLRDHRLCQGFLGEKIFYTDSSDLCAYLLAQGFEPNALDTLPFFEPFLLDAYVALCCAFALSRKRPSIVAAGFIPTLASFTIGAHRVEEFYVCAFGAEWLFVDDSKGTNIDATLKAIARYKDRALFLILGGDDKGADMQEIFTLLAGLKRVEIFTIGTNESKLLDLAARHSVKAHKCGTLDRAMEKIWAMIAESSTRLAQDFVCLLSPAAASLDQFSSYKERGELFKTLAKELANRH